MSRKKLQLVPDKRVPCVSGLSPEEEKRALALGDLALHGPAPPPEPPGIRARADHQLLTEDVGRETENVRRMKRVA